MTGIELKPMLQELIHNISVKNTYYGNKISPAIMNKFEVEIKENSAGILVPFWLAVLEHGRGPRKNKTDHGLWKKIYAWMEKHNMFEYPDNKSRIREAKFITLYINKYGNKQFRSKTFIDIYSSEREKTIQKVYKEFNLQIGKITMEVI
jgi:hypothetical protein